MKFVTAKRSLRSSVAVLCVAAYFSGHSLYAQEVGAQARGEGEDIVVTGSRIARPDFSNPNPVVTVDAEDILKSGQTNLTEFLADNPALLGSTRNIDGAGSSLPNAGLVGVNFLNLRNLGASRTLVLVDGKRHVAGYAGSAAVDINTIPTDLVERVDVLTGGVSAVYGADGVSGVVNFILKKDFEGLSLRAQNGISQRGDAGQRFISATAGRNFADNRGNVAIAYEFSQDDRFREVRRLNYGKTGPSWALVPNRADYVSDDPNIPDYVLETDLRWADSSRAGAVILGHYSYYYDPVDGFLLPEPSFNGDGRPYDVGSYVPETPFTIGGSSTARESYYGDFTPYSQRHIVNALASYEFSSAFKVGAELKFVKSTAMTEGQPNYDLYTYLTNDNAYLINLLGNELAVGDPDCVPSAFVICGGAMVSRDNFDFGARRSELKRELWRAVVSASGDITPNLRYDASFVFGDSKQTAKDFNDLLADRYYAALDAVDDGHGGVTCRINLPGETIINGDSLGNSVVFGGMAPITFAPGQCVPLNILGEGSPSQEALDFVLLNHSSSSRLRQYVASFNLSGDTQAFFSLPGGPVGFAVGAEYRKERSYFEPSEYVLEGLTMGAPALIERGGFDVKELYGEVRMPILADVAFAKELSFGAALRLSDYSTVGSTTTWNLNLSYAPVRDLAFRGTYSRSVRAPNISELFSPISGTYEFIEDPCGIDKLALGTEYRQANCAAALNAININPATFNPALSSFSPQNSSLLGQSSGNPDLSPEKATTWTAGLVLRPSFVPNLSVSFDWYDIKLTRAIQYASVQDIVDLCYDQPDLNNVYCSLFSRGDELGFIDYFEVVPQNVAAFRTAGLDMNLRYSVDLGQKAGQLQFRLVGNYLNKLSFVPSFGADAKDERQSAAYPAPKYSANFDVTWIKGPFSINYGIDWHDKLRRISRETLREDPDYSDPKYFWYREKWEHELHLAYDVQDRFQIYGGVNNLWDRKPDDGASAFPISAVGRYFYAGVKAKIF